MIMEYVLHSAFDKATVFTNSLFSLDLILYLSVRSWLKVSSKNDCGITFIYSPSTGYLAKQIR